MSPRNKSILPRLMWPTYGAKPLPSAKDRRPNKQRTSAHPNVLLAAWPLTYGLGLAKAKARKAQTVRSRQCPQGLATKPASNMLRLTMQENPGRVRNLQPPPLFQGGVRHNPRLHNLYT